MKLATLMFLFFIAPPEVSNPTQYGFYARFAGKDHCLQTCDNSATQMLQVSVQTNPLVDSRYGSEAVSVTTWNVPVLPPDSVFLFFDNRVGQTTLEEAQGATFSRYRFVRKFTASSHPINTFYVVDAIDKSASDKFIYEPLNKRETLILIRPRANLAPGLYFVDHAGYFIISVDGQIPQQPCYDVAVVSSPNAIYTYYSAQFNNCH